MVRIEVLEDDDADLKARQAEMRGSRTPKASVKAKKKGGRFADDTLLKTFDRDKLLEEFERKEQEMKYAKAGKLPDGSAPPAGTSADEMAKIWTAYKEKQQDKVREKEASLRQTKEKEAQLMGGKVDSRPEPDAERDKRRQDELQRIKDMQDRKRKNSGGPNNLNVPGAAGGLPQSASKPEIRRTASEFAHKRTHSAGGAALDNYDEDDESESLNASLGSSSAAGTPKRQAPVSAIHEDNLAFSREQLIANIRLKAMKRDDGPVDELNLTARSDVSQQPEAKMEYSPDMAAQANLAEKNVTKISASEWIRKRSASKNGASKSGSATPVGPPASALSDLLDKDAKERVAAKRHLSRSGSYHQRPGEAEDGEAPDQLDDGYLDVTNINPSGQSFNRVKSMPVSPKAAASASASATPKKSQTPRDNADAGGTVGRKGSAARRFSNEKKLKVDVAGAKQVGEADDGGGNKTPMTPLTPKTPKPMAIEYFPPIEGAVKSENELKRSNSFRGDLKESPFRLETADELATRGGVISRPKQRTMVWNEVFNISAELQAMALHPENSVYTKAIHRSRRLMTEIRDLMVEKSFNDVPTPPTHVEKARKLCKYGENLSVKLTSIEQYMDQTKASEFIARYTWVLTSFQRLIILPEDVNRICLGLLGGDVVSDNTFMEITSTFFTCAASILVKSLNAIPSVSPAADRAKVAETAWMQLVCAETTRLGRGEKNPDWEARAKVHASYNELSKAIMEAPAPTDSKDKEAIFISMTQLRNFHLLIGTAYRVHAHSDAIPKPEQAPPVRTATLISEQKGVGGVGAGSGAARSSLMQQGKLAPKKYEDPRVMKCCTIL